MRGEGNRKLDSAGYSLIEDIVSVSEMRHSSSDFLGMLFSHTGGSQCLTVTVDRTVSTCTYFHIRDSDCQLLALTSSFFRPYEISEF